MRIGIDARFLGSKQKGLGRYVQELVENLEKVVNLKGNGDLEFVIFLRKDNWKNYHPKDYRFRKVLADYKWYSLKEQIFLPFVINKEKLDLMHFPHFNVPVFYFRPFIITVHDLILKRFPTRKASTLNLLSYYFKNLAYSLVISIALKRAKKIISVSYFTKKDILKYFKINPKKIIVIYEGVVGQPIKNNSQKNKNFLKEKYGIKKDYLLYVGNAYPHKNLENLIDAFSKLVLIHKMDIQLVLVGQLDYFYKRLIVFSEGCPSLVAGSIIFTDYVDDSLLKVLYKNASLYVFPSLCEGFGLPPLEAMKYGTPVASSNATCLPEVLGKAAVYFNPNKSNDITLKVKTILKDKKIKDKLRSLGLNKSEEYSWKKTAKKTLKIYKSVGIS